jgi:hypothetical protein
MVAGALALATTASTLAAQQGLTAANGTTSILTTTSSVVTVDTKDAALGMVGKFGTSDRDYSLFDNAQVTLAASEGKSDLFTMGQITPNITLQDRLAYSLYSRGLLAVYGSAGVNFAERPVAHYTDSSKTQIAVGQRLGESATLGGGVNWKPTPTAGELGFAMTGTRSWASPVPTLPVQVCVNSATGVDSKGHTVTAATCSNRFFGAIRDLYGGQLRADYLSQRIWHGDPRKRTVEQSDSAAWIRDTTAQSRFQAAQKSADATLKLRARALAEAEAQLASASGGAGPEQLSAYFRSLHERDTAQAEATLQSDSAKYWTTESKGAKTAFDQAKHDYRNVPQFAMIAAVSTDLRQYSRTAYNVAVGPAVTPPLMPDNIIGALMLEVDDISDASGQVPTFADRFAVRLYIGVPF